MSEGGNPKNIASIYDQYDDATKGFVNYGNYLSASGEQPSVTNGTGSVLFTDASGTEQINFASGTTIYVKVDDTDQNADVNTAETVTVTVVSESDATGETVTLTETGVSTGIFLGSVSASLTATSGDILTATYVDPLDDFGNEVTLIDEAYYNVTLLSGSYTGNVTWSASSSPFLVTGDVTIGTSESMGSLTIDPGVEVRFLRISDDQNSGVDGNRSEIIVYGSLSAVGTSSDSIVFKTSRGTPGAGDWHSLQVRGNYSGNTEVSHCRFSGYNSALYLRFIFFEFWRRIPVLKTKWILCNCGAFCFFFVGFCALYMANSGVQGNQFTYQYNTVESQDIFSGTSYNGRVNPYSVGIDIKAIFSNRLLIANNDSFKSIYIDSLLLGMLTIWILYH